MAQPNKHSIHVKKRSKPKLTSVKDFYKDLFTFKTLPVSQALLDRLAGEMVRWAIEDEDALTITQFAIKKKINPSTISTWAKKHEVIRIAREAAKQIIGSRREVGAIKNKYNANVIMRQQHVYDEEWWTTEVKRAELKARTQQREDTDIRYTVVLEDFGRDGKKTDNMPEDKL